MSDESDPHREAPGRPRPWPSSDPLPGIRRRLGPWTLAAAAGPTPGLIANLDLPAPQRLYCLFSGLTLVSADPGPACLRIFGPLAMRVCADRVEDADAAADATDALFELLSGVVGSAPSG